MTETEEAAATDIVPAATNPLAIIEAMSQNPACDVEKLKGLMDLAERWQARDAREAFVRAFADFQEKCPIIGKGRVAQGDRMSFRYAGFSDIMQAIQPVLAACGLSVSFSSDLLTDGRLHIACTVSHGTHSEVSEFTCPVPSQMRVNDTQKMGAALSYAKRYCLCAALNIVVADEDFDGAPPSPQPAKDPFNPQAPPRADRGSPIDDLRQRIDAVFGRWAECAGAVWGQGFLATEGPATTLRNQRWWQYVHSIIGRHITRDAPFTGDDISRIEETLVARHDPRPVGAGDDQ